MSKYVCILVKKDVKGRDPKAFFTEQLEVFLQDGKQNNISSFCALVFVNLSTSILLFYNLVYFWSHTFFSMVSFEFIIFHSVCTLNPQTIAKTILLIQNSPVFDF